MIKIITSTCVFTLLTLIQLPANAQEQPVMCPDATSCEGLSQKDINEREMWKTRDRVDLTALFTAPLESDSTVKLPGGGELAKQVAKLSFIENVSSTWKDRMQPMREKLESSVAKKNAKINNLYVDYQRKNTNDAFSADREEYAKKIGKLIDGKEHIEREWLGGKYKLGEKSGKVRARKELTDIDVELGCEIHARRWADRTYGDYLSRNGPMSHAEYRASYVDGCYDAHERGRLEKQNPVPDSAMNEEAGWNEVLEGLDAEFDQVLANTESQASNFVGSSNQVSIYDVQNANLKYKRTTGGVLGVISGDIFLAAGQGVSNSRQARQTRRETHRSRTSYSGGERYTEANNRLFYSKPTKASTDVPDCNAPPGVACSSD